MSTLTIHPERFLDVSFQNENENVFPVQSKPMVQPLIPEKRVFGRNITNIPQTVVDFTGGQFMKPQPLVHQPSDTSSSGGSDVGEEPKALKPFESYCPCLVKEGEKKEPMVERTKGPCAEYEEEIDSHLFLIEQANPPKLDQTELTEKMRAILVDWLADVHLRFKLQPETLFLTVNIIDRYLGRSSVPRQKLQLLGVTAMLIACKYEEIYAPEVKDFAYITDNSYTKDEILQMEQQVLKTLEFCVTIPSSYRFLQRFLQYLNSPNKKTEYMAQYLIELSLIDCKMRKYTPSTVAAAALYISNRMLNKDKCWNPTMGKKTRHTDFELKPAVKELMILMQLAEKSTLKATRNKFLLPKYGEVAKLTFKRKIVS